MKRNLQTLVVTVSISIAASFLIGCSTPSIVGRTDPGQPSVQLVQAGYDTFGRQWEKPHPKVVTSQPERQWVRESVTVAKPETLTRKESARLSYAGTITDIDYENREFTLQDSQGGSQTFIVDKEVRRFSDAKVGDKVSIDYYLGFNAEVRPPTEEEKQNPMVVLDTSRRTGTDAPSGYDVRQLRALVTIEGLDRKAQTLTVKGPRGKYFTARVEDPSRFEKVQIGDTIVMTFTESTAVSLNPAPKEAVK